MDVYFSDQVNDPSLRLFSSTKTLKESLDESVFEDDPIIASAIAAATSGACLEIDELLKRQKERRANEAKFSVDKNISTKATDYSTGGNKHNVVTVKNTSFIHQQKENTNNLKLLSDQQTVVKNENVVPPRPIFQQQSPPSPTMQNKYPDSNTIDQYLLSWNNFLGNMSRGFHTLQKDEKMVDVTIAAGGKIFKAHKLVLSVCSPYFQEIFLENPSNHPILLMADVEANHMAGLLNFMYSGQVNVKYEDLPVFLKVAEAMKIKGLHTEKPEGQNLKEIQFSRDDSSTDFEVLNSSPISIPVDIIGQSLPTSLLKREDGAFHATLHPTDHNRNSETFCHNMNAVSFEQAKNKFSILKPSAGKKMLDHAKQQKYLAKRKIFVQCESDLKEKRKPEIADNEPYNKNHPNIWCMSHMIPNRGENFSNDEVLDLAQNGVSNNTANFFPMITADTTNSCQYNQTTFTEIRKSNRVVTNSLDEEMTSCVPKLCEDGNNNICKEGPVCGTKNSVSSRTEITFCNNDTNKNCDNGFTCSINDNNNNNYNTESDSKNDNLIKKHKTNCNDDNNNDYTNENNESKTCVLRKYADNNNNVFITLKNNPDSNENESKAESAKPQQPLQTCSSPY